MVIKTVDLDDDQINTIMRCLSEKREDLQVILKNPDGLNAETIRDLQLEYRYISECLRELQYYAIMK